METSELKKCESCGKEVPEYTLDRFGECSWCRANERETDMCVGDLNKK